MQIRTQRGYLLLELLAAMLLATLLAVWAVDAMVGRINDAAAQASAAWMLSLRDASRHYLERHGEALKSAVHAADLLDKGYADWSAPALAELRADGLLPAGFPGRAALAGARVRVFRSAACPGPGCRLDALVHSDAPLVRAPAGPVDEQAVAQWMLASQGWGGSVRAAQPDLIGGAAFRFPNPPWPGAALPPGTVALTVAGAVAQSQDSDFLRVGDHRDPDFQGPASVQGDVSTGGDLRIARHLHLGSQAMLYAACGQEGAVSREAEGGLAICRGGSWRTASRSGGGGFSVNQMRGCYSNQGASTANPLTGSCSCPVGSAMVQISDSGPQAFPEGRTLGYLCLD